MRRYLLNTTSIIALNNAGISHENWVRYISQLILTELENGKKK